MSEVKYLLPCQGGRWAIGREIFGTWVHLIQDTPVDDSADVENVLRALSIELTPENMDHYFPHGKCQEMRSPTLDLLELFAHLGATGHGHGV